MWNVKPCGYKAERQGGNITLEVALVLPLFLLIMAGILDLGMLYWEKHILTNASREGARAAARANGSSGAEQSVSQVQQLVQDYLNRSLIKDAGGASVTLVLDSNFFYNWDTSVTPARLWVELRDIPVKMMLLPNVQQLLGGTLSSVVPLSAKTTMAAEWTTHP
jgi:Flp pilus assembly protein TadG